MSLEAQNSRIQNIVHDAYQARTPLLIHGGNSKRFYGRQITGQQLNVSHHGGIIHYEPTELVITAAAGTPLSEIESVLAEHNQMLAFEPPHFGDRATLGGAIATGLSGPRRPYAGSARDFVLGVKLINGKGELLHFGGEVMKNVAGYDLSRLLTGSLGTLGILLEVSLKVLPRPAMETTLINELPADKAQAIMLNYGRQSLPVSGCCHDGRYLYTRLSGTEQAIKVAVKNVPGDQLDEHDRFWEKLRDHQLPFFDSEQTMWRLSVPANASDLNIEGECFIDWGGAQRWIKSSMDAEYIRTQVSTVQGHATQFRHGDTNAEYFHPLSGKLKQIHLHLKLAFDPNCILNPTRMYSDF